MRQTNGFALVELLVSASLLLILLGALGGLFRSTTLGYQADDRATSSSQSRESVQQVLRYEVGLAGYRGATRSDYDASAAAATDPFTITPNTSNGSDQITVKYFEDRVYGTEAKTLKTVVFSVDPQTNVLRRSQNGGAAEPIATNVKRLKVARYLVQGSPSSDCLPACTTKPSSGTTGVVLSITYLDNSVRRLSITFQNPVAT